MGVNLKDAVIIFDEGHNIEDVAENAMEFELKLKDIQHTKQLKENNKELCWYLKNLEGFKTNQIYYFKEWTYALFKTSKPK